MCADLGEQVKLTQVVQGANTTESYSYDAVGNRLSSLGLSPYQYNNSNELTSTPDTTFTYDNNGNTLTKTDSNGATGYTWDYENRLTSVTLPGSGGTVTFKYDPFGRRIQKSGPAGTTNYLYDGANVVTDLDAGGAVTASYAQGSGIDEPLASMTAEGTAFFEADGLGSITSLSGASVLTDTYIYNAFGVTTATGTNTNRFRYTGREWDSETGLYYYRARYYDPTTGRFLSEDPIGFGGDGTNFYAYVGNSPANFVDPSGEQSGAAAPSTPPVVPKPPAKVIPFPEPPPSIGDVFLNGLTSLAKDAVGIIAVVLALEGQTANEAQDTIAGHEKSCDNNDPCKGLRDILKEHEQKLQDYTANPYAHDNKGFLGKGRDEAVIAGRIRSLQRQIENFRKLLEECEKKHGRK